MGHISVAFIKSEKKIRHKLIKGYNEKKNKKIVDIYSLKYIIIMYSFENFLKMNKSL